MNKRIHLIYHAPNFYPELVLPVKSFCDQHDLKFTIASHSPVDNIDTVILPKFLRQGERLNKSHGRLTWKAASFFKGFSFLILIMARLIWKRPKIVFMTYEGWSPISSFLINLAKKRIVKTVYLSHGVHKDEPPKSQGFFQSLLFSELNIAGHGFCPYVRAVYYKEKLKERNPEIILFMGGFEGISDLNSEIIDEGHKFILELAEATRKITPQFGFRYRPHPKHRHLVPESLRIYCHERTDVDFATEVKNSVCVLSFHSTGLYEAFYNNIAAFFIDFPPLTHLVYELRESHSMIPLLPMNASVVMESVNKELSSGSNPCFSDIELLFQASLESTLNQLMVNGMAAKTPGNDR